MSYFHPPPLQLCSFCTAVTVQKVHKWHPVTVFKKKSGLSCTATWMSDHSVQSAVVFKIWNWSHAQTIVLICPLHILSLWKAISAACRLRHQPNKHYIKITGMNRSFLTNTKNSAKVETTRTVHFASRWHLRAQEPPYAFDPVSQELPQDWHWHKNSPGVACFRRKRKRQKLQETFCSFCPSSSTSFMFSSVAST